LLYKVAPDEEKPYVGGAKEIEDEIKKMKQRITGNDSQPQHSANSFGSLLPLKRNPFFATNS
jgi:hypothetical protein